MSYFDFYSGTLNDNQIDELNGLMAIHEKAGARPYDAAMQAVRDKLAQAHENKAEVERVLFESANPLKKYVDSAAHKAASSPKNNLPIPTAAQRETGNHTMGHLTLHGLSITIEIPKGGERSGVAPDGTPWSVEMLSHYGYLKRAIGADGENFDCYIGDDPSSQRVWIVDQVNAETGAFDEHKALLGYEDQEDATRAYLGAFSDGKGKARIGAITEISLESFKAWLKTDKTQKPMSAVLESEASSILESAANLKIATDNGETTVNSLLSRIAKAKGGQKDLLYTSVYGDSRRALLEAAILKLPKGPYTLSIKGRMALSLVSAIESLYGTLAGTDVDERLIRGLAVKYPKKIRANLTLGLQEIILESAAEEVRAAAHEATTSRLYDYKSEIEKAATFEDIQAVFSRVFTVSSTTDTETEERIPKQIKAWLNKIKKAKDRDKKTSIYYEFLNDGGDGNKLLQEMVLSLPAGSYKLHSREYGTNIMDEIFNIYGTMPSYLIKEPLLLGLTAVKPEKIHATFTHDMDKIEIYK